MSLRGLAVPLCVFFAFFVSCATAPKGGAPTLVSGPKGQLLFDVEAKNSDEAMKRPYVVLVSIDGYRYDYNRLFSPPHLTRLEAEGVAAEGLRPPYPSKTFPSHYAIATGLPADRHGIVSNDFYDPALKASYAIRDRDAIANADFYFGEPLWVTAGRQGMLSASFFWIGSEAPVGGRYPNYFYRYDGKIPNEARVDQVLEWLKLPPERRPHLITLYFDAVDTAAHRYGVHSPQTRDAVMEIDRMIGRLREGLVETGLPVNLIVVSDHGMQDVSSKKVISVDEDPEAARILKNFKAVGRGPQMHLYLNEGEPLSVVEEAKRVLAKSLKNARVLKRAELENLKYAATPRAGDLVIDADLPYVIGFRNEFSYVGGANHGWDPKRYREMLGIFYAVGPQFKEKFKLPVVDNVHVYPLILRILGLKQYGPVDGQLEPMYPSLRESGVR